MRPCGSSILGEGKNECQGWKNIEMTMLYNSRVALYNALAYQGLRFGLGVPTTNSGTLFNMENTL